MRKIDKYDFSLNDTSEKKRNWIVIII